MPTRLPQITERRRAAMRSASMRRRSARKASRGLSWSSER
jgi:hypothetical protein